MSEDSSQDVVMLLTLIRGAFAGTGSGLGGQDVEAFVPCPACAGPISVELPGAAHAPPGSEDGRLCGRCREARALEP
jgi:hypothetical protein